MPLSKDIMQKSYHVMYKYFCFRRSQYWDENKLQQYQMEKLRKILFHAKRNVPYYQELFKKINLDPDDIKSKNDLQKIPVLRRQDIINDKDKLISKNYKDFNPTWKHTSGTTGSPLSFLIDKNAQITTFGSMLRCYNWAGYLPGKKVFSLQQGESLNFKGIKKLRLQRTIILRATSLNKEYAIEMHKLLFKFKPDYYIAYPFSLVNFIKYGLDNIDPIYKPKAVICQGENLDPLKRSYIENHLNCKVYDFYGHIESVVMGMEDSFGNKFLMDDFGLHEVINENTLKPAKNGETGTLIGTGLNNYSMPFIRYQTDDRIKTLPENESQKRLSLRIRLPGYSQLEGRKNDVIMTPDGRKLSLLSGILNIKLEGIMFSQLVQEKLDSLKLRILPGKDFNKDSLVHIKREMQKYIGNNMNYEFEIVDHLEISKEGKIPFIIQRLNSLDLI